jgi:hypothetical protein
MNNILNNPAFVIHLKEICPERRDFFTKNITDAGYTNMILFEGVDASKPDILHLFSFKTPKFSANHIIICFWDYIAWVVMK